MTSTHFNHRGRAVRLFKRAARAGAPWYVAIRHQGRFLERGELVANVANKTQALEEIPHALSQAVAAAARRDDRVHELASEGCGRVGGPDRLCERRVLGVGAQLDVEPRVAGAQPARAAVAGLTKGAVRLEAPTDPAEHGAGMGEVDPRVAMFGLVAHGRSRQGARDDRV